jgi:uncharacterized protein YwgA
MRTAEARATDDDWLERTFAELRIALEPTPEQTERAWLELQARLQQPALDRLNARLARFESGTGSARLLDRKDLLLILLGAGGSSSRPAAGVCGTTRILKMLFLAAKELAAGALVPEPYRFQPYRFGPFAPELHDDLAILGRAGLVRRDELDEDGTPVLQSDVRVDEGLGFNGLRTVYRLTARGRRFAAALLKSAVRRKPTIEAGLSIIKAQWGVRPLREFLRYIYTRYPEYTTESEILEQVLGKRSR